MITILIFGVFIAFVSRWWSQYSQRAARVAELQAIAMNTHPVLFISEAIGDSTVMARAENFKLLLSKSKNPIIGPEDVYTAIYKPRNGEIGGFHLNFPDWHRLEMDAHYRRVAQWEAKVLGNQTNQLTDHGRYTLHGQQAPSVDPTQWQHVTAR